MQENKKSWYTNWFDTPFYHILYKDRDYDEAQLFIENITHYLNLPEQAKVLDLACGRGRHSIFLNKLGYDVIYVHDAKSTGGYIFRMNKKWNLL